MLRLMMAFAAALTSWSRELITAGMPDYPVSETEAPTTEAPS